MDRYRIAGFWLQTKGYIKHNWYALIHNQSGQMISRRQVVVGKVQANYQVDKSTAEHCVNVWEKRINSFG
jgi:uncharacterized protein YjbJ (UPF0337 family)